MLDAVNILIVSVLIANILIVNALEVLSFLSTLSLAVA